MIGTPEQIAERVAAYRKRGVDLILGGFLHFQEEIEYFGAKVLPLVREIEESEEDSVDSPVLASACSAREGHRPYRCALAWIAKAVESHRSAPQHRRGHDLLAR